MELFPMLALLNLMKKKIKMDFRRARRGVRFVAVHQSGAHEPAGRERFGGHEPAAAGSRRAAARGVLRLPFARNQMAAGIRASRRSSWLVVSDVNEGRRHLNFSDWPTRSRRAAKKLERINEMLDYREMPPKKYTAAPPRSPAHRSPAQTTDGLAATRGGAMKLRAAK